MIASVPLAPGNALVRFRVLAIDEKLSLYVLGDGNPQYDAGSAEPLPREFPLDRATTYVLRYDNNDGGPGTLHFQVVEGSGAGVTRYEMNISTIVGPTVIECRVSFRVDPALPPPALAAGDEGGYVGHKAFGGVS